MSRRFPILVTCLLLTGCAAAVRVDPVPGTRSTVVADPLPGLNKGALTHEGGIVFGQSLDQIRDAGKRAAASTLQVELSLVMRVDRTMRNAALIAEAPKAFALLAANPSPHPSPANAKAKASADPAATGGGRMDGAATGPEPAQASSRPAGAQAAAAKQEAELRASAAAQLAATAGAYHQAAPDVVQPGADGGQVVTSKLDVHGLDGDRAVTLVRTYDAAGDLVAQTERLEGGTQDARITAERTRTYAADGTLAVDASIRLALPGGDHVVAWHPRADAGGALAGPGTIARPDGTTVQLDVTGALGELEDLVAIDGKAGVRATLHAAPGATTATLTIDAGTDGQIRLEVPADAQAAGSP